MAKRDIIVIGASAGGVEALSAVVAGLPAQLPATVLVVLHMPGDSRSMLPAILARATELSVTDPKADPRLLPGRLFVAPPDHHMTIHHGRVRLSRGARVNRHRPAVDPLFESAAREAGPRVIGVVLSGTLDDGTAGMREVARFGGTTIVQDPADAVHSGMPRSVLAQVPVDLVLPVSEIPRALIALAGQAIPDTSTGPGLRRGARRATAQRRAAARPPLPGRGGNGQAGRRAPRPPGRRATRDRGGLTPPPGGVHV